LTLEHRLWEIHEQQFGELHGGELWVLVNQVEALEVQEGKQGRRRDRAMATEEL